MAERSFTLVLAGNSRSLARALKRARGDVDDFGQRVGRLMRLAGAAAAAGVAAAGAAAVKLTVDLVRAGDQFDKMSKRTGVSVEGLQRLKFAAEQSGSGIETVEKALKRQGKFLADADRGLATYTRQLDELGLSVDDFEGRSPDEAFRRFADAISAVEDPIRRTALAQEVFGRAGTELIPLLAEGSAGITALGDQMARTGNIISAETAESAAKFNDTLNELKNIGLGGFRSALTALLPHLVSAAEWVRDVMVPALRAFAADLAPVVADLRSELLPALSSVLDAARPVVVWLGRLARDGLALAARHGRLLVPVLAGVATAVAALKIAGAVTAIRALVVSVRSWTVAQGGLNAALRANPIGLVATALGLLAAGIVYAWQNSETFRRVATAAFEAVRAVVAEVVDKILAYVDLWLAGVERVASAAGWLASKVGISLDGVSGAVTSARDAIAAARDRIADSFSSAADAVERSSQRQVAAVRSTQTAVLGLVDEGSRASARYAGAVARNLDAANEAFRGHALRYELTLAHMAKLTETFHSPQGAIGQFDQWDRRLGRGSRVDAALAEVRSMMARTAQSASKMASATLSESQRLAAGLRVEMANACGTVTGFRECVDGVVVEFDAAGERVLSDAQRLADGLAVPIVNACGTVTGFRQCVDGAAVEFDANMNRVVASAARMAAGVGSAARSASAQLAGLLGPVQARQRVGDLTRGDITRRDAQQLAASRSVQARLDQLVDSGAGDTPAARALRKRLDAAGVPDLAAGGIVRARPGGMIVRVAEAGRDEAIIPLGAGGTPATTVNLNLAINVEGSVLVESDFREAVLEAVSEGLRRGELSLDALR